MKRLDELYNSFVDRINLIYDETIAPFLSNENIYEPTEKELINVEFCYTFIHSALEGYVETICDIHYRIMKDLFDRNHIMNNCVSSLLILYNDMDDNYQSHSNFINYAIKESFTKLNRKMVDNHGVSRRHLITMLPYVGLDLPDTRLMNSIDTIAKTRGDFAHNLKAKIRRTAEDGFGACNDALEFAKALYDNAKREYNFYKRKIR